MLFPDYPKTPKPHFYENFPVNHFKFIHSIEIWHEKSVLVAESQLFSLIGLLLIEMCQWYPE